MTAPASVHPRSPEDLLPGALALADQLGELPSRNRLMREFKIGAPKADTLRDLLTVERDGDADRAPVQPPADPWLHAQPIGPNPSPVPAVPEPARPVSPDPAPVAHAPAANTPPQVAVDGHPVPHITTNPATSNGRQAVVWPVVLLALPAFIAVWSGWVGLGGLTGFGVVHPLPGIADEFSLNTAITLPIGVETYGAYALYVWLSGRVPDLARRFAKWSAIASLAVGALGQIAYHLLTAAGITVAPWWITTAVSVLPVAVLGMGAALAHLVRSHH